MNIYVDIPDYILFSTTTEAGIEGATLIARHSRVDSPYYSSTLGNCSILRNAMDRDRIEIKV